jgi:predicted SAM-dependent methyltransferase
MGADVRAAIQFLEFVRFVDQSREKRKHLNSRIAQMEFSHTKISLRRPLSDYSRVRALYGHILRGRNFQFRKLNEQPYLNVGCGPKLLHGFVNLDYLWVPGIDLCWDITKGIPLPNHSLKGIFSEHCLEHFDKSVATDIVRDFHRLLKPDGTLRIVVPDAELYIDLYVKVRNGEAVKFPYVEGKVLPIDPLNRIFREHGHLYAYDFCSMREMILSAGFSAVTRTSFMKGRDPKLLVDSPERAIESLYVEAR